MTAFAAALFATVIAVLTAALIALARWHDKPALAVADPTPYEHDVPPEPDWYAIDPPVTRLYVDPQWTDITEHVQGIPVGDGLTEVHLTMTRDALDGWTHFRGGLVHTACVSALLRDGTRPCGRCAGHLDQVLTGAK